ncbi:MAG: hypothetical protein K0S94_2581 [Nitrospira sp.]|nr:hypothetical protein [Nitrospira sp.]
MLASLLKLSDNLSTAGQKFQLLLACYTNCLTGVGPKEALSLHLSVFDECHREKAVGNCRGVYPSDEHRTASADDEP